MEICGKKGAYFKSPEVCHFVRENQRQVYENITEFRQKYLSALNKLHHSDTLKGFDQKQTEKIERVYADHQTSSYVNIKCNRKCRFALWFKFDINALN